MTWAIPGQWGESRWTPDPPQKRFLSEMWFFRDSGFPMAILVIKPLQALCVSASKWYINIFSTSFHCGLIGILRLPKVQLFFSMGILGGVKMQTSRAAYNGPKQQWYNCAHFRSTKQSLTFKYLDISFSYHMWDPYSIANHTIFKLWWLECSMCLAQNIILKLQHLKYNWF